MPNNELCLPRSTKVTDVGRLPTAGSRVHDRWALFSGEYVSHFGRGSGDPLGAG